MLFTLVLDILDYLIQRAVASGPIHRLTASHAASSISLYADDVVILCHPDQHDITTIKELLPGLWDCVRFLDEHRQMLGYLDPLLRSLTSL